jgi:hypothetical protein
MWDEEDGFFLPRVSIARRARPTFEGSLHGWTPALCAVTAIDDELRRKDPTVLQCFMDFYEARPELKTFIHDPVEADQVLELGKAAAVTEIDR